MSLGREQLRSGLAHVLSDVPVRSGYLEASALWAPTVGLTGRLEAGYRPHERVGLFGWGELNSTMGPMAGVGARVLW